MHTLAKPLLGAALALTLAGLAGTAQAATFNVGDAASLIAAIHDANSNGEADIIDLGGNIITLSAVDNVNPTTGNGGLPQIGANGLPVIGTDGGHALTIRNGTIQRTLGDATPRFRLIQALGTATLTLDTVTLQGGYTESLRGGGAILTSDEGISGSLTVLNSTITGNTASGAGGGISAFSSLTLKDSEVSENLALGNGSDSSGGGGIRLEGGNHLISDSRIINNRAEGSFSFANGGGIGSIFNPTKLRIERSLISGNHAARDGGGIGLQFPNGGDFESQQVIDSTISNNSAGADGGGIRMATGRVIRSTFTGNTAGQYGGGLSIQGTVTRHNTVSGNSATFGGGISGRFGSSIAYTTVTDNTATEGGNYYAHFGPVQISNSLIADAAGGGDCVSSGASNAALVASGSNFDTDGTCATFAGSGVVTDPNAGLLGPLAENGGPTQTHALLAGNPAIDAAVDVLGQDACGLGSNATDQRGVSRPQGPACDVGAFELAPAGPDYGAAVQPPINSDGSSVFNAKRGVVPVKFLLLIDGQYSCDLPPATIALTRIGGTGDIGPITEGTFSGAADSGSSFRITGCEYHYNLNVKSLKAGEYRVDILIDGNIVGSATFALK